MSGDHNQHQKAGAPIYTESAYKAAQLRAKGMMLADLLTEIQAIETFCMKHGEVYNPDHKIHDKSDDYKAGWMAALQHMRIRFEIQHHGATREAKKIIGKANSQAYALVQCANVLLELANPEDEE